MNITRRSVFRSQRFWVTLTVIAMFALAGGILMYQATQAKQQPIAAPTPEATSTAKQAEAEVRKILDSGFRLQSPIAQPSES